MGIVWTSKDMAQVCSLMICRFIRASQVGVRIKSFILMITRLFGTVMPLVPLVDVYKQPVRPWEILSMVYTLEFAMTRAVFNPSAGTLMAQLLSTMVNRIFVLCPQERVKVVAV